MANLKIYEINPKYIDYLAQYENHIFHNAKSNQFIKSKELLIIENAKKVYEHKLRYNNESKLGKRCNDFAKLEKLCKEF